MKILVAGASGGIGHFLSEKFDSIENELILTYNKNADKVYQTKQAQAHVFKCDFTNKSEVEHFYNQINQIDAIINVMGHFENKLLTQMDEEEWDRVIASNLKTAFFSCRYGVEKVVEHGHIINISSVLGTMGMIGATNYVAAKGGVEALTKSFALECLLKRKVFVNAIALGYFKIGMGLRLSEKIEKMMTDKIPLKDFGEPEEIYKAITFILSSKYLVGQVIHLNGGLRI